jgi:DNA-3-methyladenine glycosylase II
VVNSSLVAAPRRLSAASLARGVAHLTARDPDLARVVAAYGPPPLWAREPGFATLVQIILEQQVSLASAKAVYDRLVAFTGPLTPAHFLALDGATLRHLGFSRQKTAYVRHLAEAVLAGDIDLAALATMSAAEARAELIKLKGIGAWTAEIYLLMALRTPDAWPVGDLGLILAVQSVKRLPARPTADELMAIGEQWRPWRAVATRILWRYYLSRQAERAANGLARQT